MVDVDGTKWLNSMDDMRAMLNSHQSEIEQWVLEMMAELAVKNRMSVSNPITTSVCNGVPYQRPSTHLLLHFRCLCSRSEARELDIRSLFWKFYVFYTEPNIANTLNYIQKNEHTRTHTDTHFILHAFTFFHSPSIFFYLFAKLRTNEKLHLQRQQMGKQFAAMRKFMSSRRVSIRSCCRCFGP